MKSLEAATIQQQQLDYLNQKFLNEAAVAKQWEENQKRLQAEYDLEELNNKIKLNFLNSLKHEAVMLNSYKVISRSFVYSYYCPITTRKKTKSYKK